MKNQRVKTIWVGPEAIDAVAFAQVLPIDAIVALDYGSDVQELEKTYPVFSLEKNTGIKMPWSNFHMSYLFQNTIQQSVHAYAQQDLSKFQFLCYCASGSLDLFITNSLPQAKNLAIPIWQKLYFDDKILFHIAMQSLGITTFPTIIEQLWNADYKKLKKMLGEKLVIKSPLGVSGSNVYFVDNEQQFLEIQKKIGSSTVLIQTYRKGIPVNVQCIISQGQIFLAPPSVQIIGAKECSINIFDWCGNDFYINDFIPANFVSESLELTRKIAEMMVKKNYQGIFGVDLLLDLEQGKIYPLEINPRQQGSTALLTQIESINNPSSYFIQKHILAFNGYIGKNDKHKPLLSQYVRSGSQILLQYKRSAKAKVTKTVRPGVYTFDELRKEIIWKRSGSTLLDCQNNNEFILSGGIPLVGQTIMPGSSLVRIQTRAKVLKNPVTSELTSQISEICRSIYQQFAFLETTSILKR